MLRLTVLRQKGHAPGDAVHGPLSDGGPLPAREQAVGVQPGAERLGLLETEGDLVQHFTVSASDQDADLFQSSQVVHHLLEAAHEEVAHGDVGSIGVAKHPFEPLHKRR